MSCKHGNWPPCDECDADDVLYMRIQNLENECADWTKGYGLLFKQNGQLRDLIELMFSSTMPYDKSGQPTFSDAVVNLWSNLNQVDSAGPSACYDEPQPAPAAQYDASAQPSTCTWSLDDEDSSTWSSSCGELWSFIDGGPKENRVTYCHHCGKPIDVARAADKEPT